MAKHDNILDAILNGTKKDTRNDTVLRKLYWDLVREYKTSITEWLNRVENYAKNPKYNDSSKRNSNLKDRTNRLSIGMVGGYKPDEVVEFTWRKFMEALLINGSEKCYLTITATRGRFNTKKTVRIVISPEAERLRVLASKGVKFQQNQPSAKMSELFISPLKTAQQIMTHPLNRMLWLFIVEYGIEESTWNRLMNAYIRNSENCPQLKHHRNNKKHNLLKALTKPDSLTWDRFLESMKLLDCSKLEVALRSERCKGDATEVCEVIDITALNFKNKDHRYGSSNDESDDL